MKIYSNSFYNKLNFMRNTVLYTDFDATYFPFKRNDIQAKNVSAFNKMYLPFDTIQISEKQKGNTFNLVITTGRSKNDLLHTQELIEKAGLMYHKPQGMITSNGANVFIIKDGEIQDITPNSSGIDLLPDIKDIVNDIDKNVSIIECKINGDKKTYGKYSSEYELEKLPKDKRRKYVSITRDGKANLEIVISKGVNDYLIAQKIETLIESNNYPFTLEHYRNSPYTKMICYDKDKKNIEGANLILLKQKSSKGIPDKLDLIRAKLKETIDNGDDNLIIAAGDDFNDKRMLNPLNYLDLMDYDTQSKTEDEILNDKKAIDILRQMPFKSIICGDSSSLKELRHLANKLDSMGIHIICQAPNTIEDYSTIVSKILQS